MAASRGAITDAFCARVARAIGTAVDLVLRFDPVPHDPALAMGTLASHGVDGALKVVKSHYLASLGDAAASITASHFDLLARRHLKTPLGVAHKTIVAPRSSRQPVTAMRKL
jgi:predicted phosphoribosyltransferase